MSVSVSTALFHGVSSAADGWQRRGKGGLFSLRQMFPIRSVEKKGEKGGQNKKKKGRTS